MSRLSRIALVLLSILWPAGALDAQWLKEPTRGIPRTADGKPHLAAPASRTADGKPDLSGLGRFDSGPYGGNLLADLKPDEIRPGVDAIYKQRMEDLGKDDPATFRCLPPGPRVLYAPQGFARIIQTPGVIAILYEDLMFRQIFMDGRALPKDPTPSFMGYSVGRWDGDTLVVDSIGFNETSWLDFGGHPHSEALRTTERITRKFAVKVAPQILSQYVGAYTFKAPEDPNQVMKFNITRAGETLSMDIGGKDPQEMVALSNETFSIMGVRLDFVKEGDRVTHLIFHVVEGDMKATKDRR